MAANPHPPNRGVSVLAVTTTTLIVASIFVTARIISRSLVVKNVSLDDYLILLAWLIAFLMSFAIDFGTGKGLGRHDADIKSEWMPELMRSIYSFSVLYNPALMATKSSILIFYLRLSRNTKPLLRIASYVTLAVVNIAGIVLTFFCIFQCTPVGAAFVHTGRESSKCIGLVTLYLTSAPVNIITDLTIIVLPIPVLTAMRLPQKQKNILIATFGLGVFVAIVDVVRIYYLQQASMDVWTGSVSNARMGDHVDFAWYASLSLMWTAVEVNVGIICACIPTLKPLISQLKPHWIDHPVNFPGHNYLDQQSQSQYPTDNNGIGLAEFLGEQQAIRRISRVDTAMTNETSDMVNWGFVNIKCPKSMLKTRGKETVKYCTLVTILFFLWGFSSGLLNMLNDQIAKIAGESRLQTLALSSAYWGAYLLGPIVGWWVLTTGGFKATFITGLCIYGVGTLMWWPSAVLQAFPGFFVSNFVVGFGLSVLETAANPFMCLCGPEQYSEFRLLLAQGVQGVAGVIAPLLAEKVFFQNVHGRESLVDVQWAYLGITLFDVILALFFYYMPLPEAKMADIEKRARKQDGPRSNFFGKSTVIFLTLAFGTAAQFFYVSAQEGMNLFLPTLLDSITTESASPLITSHDFTLMAQTTFTLGRFFFAGFTLVISPRKLLLASFLGALVFSIVIVALPASNSNTIAAASLLAFFFEGPMFPLIFAISLRGLGRHTKAGAALLTGAVSGGGFFPFAMYAVISKGPIFSQRAFIVLVALFAACTLYSVYLNFVPKARQQVDSPKSKPSPELGLGTPKTGLRRVSEVLEKIIDVIKGEEVRAEGDNTSAKKREGSWSTMADGVQQHVEEQV